MAAGFTRFVGLLTLVLVPWLPTARAADGPEKAWVVLALPNPEITPDWQSYAPPECQANPVACALDHRFWELWDFSNFSTAIDAAFSKIAAQGSYYGVIPILPLSDTETFRNNIALLWNYAVQYGLAFDPSVFPKWKFGAEWCYLYSSGAPANCPVVSGTSTAVAYSKILDLMDYVQSLGDGCAEGSYNHQFALWYGWRDFSPGFDVLDSFWTSLPTGPCNHQAAYTIWLDEPYAGIPEIKPFQDHVVNDYQGQLWIITELYSRSALETYGQLYTPYQVVDTGFAGAPSPADWARGICSKWRDSLFSPDNLIIWTYFDRDVPPLEHYGGLIGHSLADVTSVCQY